MTRLIPLLGFICGPLMAYLLWAIMNRRTGHVIIAIVINVIFWAGGYQLLQLIAERLL